jgi:hypothetical protein
VDGLITWRDEGPLARGLGTVGRGEPALLVAAGAVPLAVAAAAGAGKGATAAAVAWLVLLGGLAAGRRGTRLAWATPAILRAAEYGGLLWLATLDGAEPAALGLLGALAYRHYDLVNRLRLHGRAPAAWVGRVAGGWEGRLLVATALVLAGAATTGYWIAAALLMALFVGESVAAWRRLEDEGDMA